MNFVRSASLLRVVLLFAAGLAIMMQAAIPAGFMPGMGKQAGSFITICSTFGEKTVFVADDAGEHSEAGDESCVYAFTIPAMGDAPAATLAYVAAFVDDQPSLWEGYSIHPVRIDLASPPTGPPLII